MLLARLSVLLHICLSSHVCLCLSSPVRTSDEPDALLVPRFHWRILTLSVPRVHGCCSLLSRLFALLHIRLYWSYLSIEIELFPTCTRLPVDVLVN
jgi:hypothetical protein